jgi:hypothetical protein
MGLRELMKVEVEESEPEQVNSLEYLQRIYRDPMQPTSMRMRAAIEALAFENPRLSAVGVGYMTNDTFAEKLDRAIARADRAKLIEGQVIGEQVREAAPSR